MVARHSIDDSIEGGLDFSVKISPARPIIEILTVVGLLFFIAEVGRANDYQLAGAVGILLSAIVVGEFLRIRGSSWREFGLIKPESLWKTLLVAIIAYVAVMGTITVAASFVLNVLGERPDVSRFNNIQSNLPLLLLWLLLSWIIGGFGEELIFRGFLMNRLAQVFGGTRVAWAAALVLQAVIFGLGHSYQGAIGIIVTGVTGLAMGAIYLIVKRKLWIPIIIHGLNDSVGFILLYFGVISTG